MEDNEFGWRVQKQGIQIKKCVARVTHNENQGTSNHTIKGGYYYMLRSHDHSANSSGVYMGGEFQGGGAGTASGNREDITIHDAGHCCGDNNEGGNADLRVNLSITGWS